MKKLEPWYWYADCTDSDYSCLCNNPEDAQTEVNDHGGVVQMLYQEADVKYLLKEIQTLKSKIKLLGASK